MNTGALGIRTVIDGVEYGDEAVRRWELDRSRAALTLLKQRIGDERMRELLALDLAESDATMAPLPNGASGAWRSAVTEMTVAGIDVDRCEVRGRGHRDVRVSPPLMLTRVCPGQSMFQMV
ncbi:hypothetical protein ACIQ9I_11605, partial [Streptomyces sp. NPDC094461]|uniref:hypothetical protein n=1 Tax=Streptomyces sp. NPDC094461 TaxID=3366064 RepID=UPI0037F506CE